MKTTYSVNYYMNHRMNRYEFIFESKYAACYEAKRIRDSYGISTDVMDNSTGEIIQIY